MEKCDIIDNIGGGVMIRISVVDDENIICTQLEGLISKAAEILSIDVEIDIYGSGEAFMKVLKANEKYDLIFLDIELDKYSGIDIGHYIRDDLSDDSTQIVFISCKNGYDRKLFEFRPMDFLEKPVNINKMINIMSKYFRIYGGQSDLFKYKVNRDNFYVNINKILYFKSEDRKIFILKESDTEEFYGTIEKVYTQLKNRGFFIPHRSYLVNYRFIKGFRAKKIIMTNGIQIPISDNRREEIFKIQLVLENGG